jgi:hypothetical protein
MFVKGVHGRELENEWDYYLSEYELAKIHKQFFEAI